MVWLHADALVLSDVRSLYDAPLGGAPAAAAEDCTKATLLRFNVSRVGLGGALPAGRCGFESGVMVLDLHQWVRLDLTSRVEYWSHTWIIEPSLLSPSLSLCLPSLASDRGSPRITWWAGHVRRARRRARAVGALLLRQGREQGRLGFGSGSDRERSRGVLQLHLARVARAR